nr:hypothetical protein [uncultured Desulfobacter sp.]
MNVPGCAYPQVDTIPDTIPQDVMLVRTSVFSERVLSWMLVPVEILDSVKVPSHLK